MLTHTINTLRRELSLHVIFLDFFSFKKKMCMFEVVELSQTCTVLCVNMPEGQRRKPAMAKLDCLFSNVNVPKMWIPSQRLTATLLREKKTPHKSQHVSDR